jgi:iron-sulfur cluster assembly protein
MSVTLTPSAALHAQKFVAGNGVGLRFGVRKSGCSGFAYVLDVAHEQRDDDLVFETEGVKILVDPISLPTVEGTQIDFVRSGLNATFVYKNPKMTAECGCGESFSVTKTASLA